MAQLSGARKLSMKMITMMTLFCVLGGDWSLKKTTVSYAIYLYRRLLFISIIASSFGIFSIRYHQHKQNMVIDNPNNPPHPYHRRYCDWQLLSRSRPTQDYIHSHQRRRRSFASSDWAHREQRILRLRYVRNIWFPGIRPNACRNG